MSCSVEHEKRFLKLCSDRHFIAQFAECGPCDQKVAGLNLTHGVVFLSKIFYLHC